MEPRVHDRLAHMLAAIASIEHYTSGLRQTDFIGQRMVIDAVERNLERLSEASRHIPDVLKAQHPQIPWREIAGIGNILRHDYPRVDPTELWETIAHDLAPLKAAIAAMLSDAGTLEE